MAIKNGFYGWHICQFSGEIVTEKTLTLEYEKSVHLSA